MNYDERPFEYLRRKHAQTSDSKFDDKIVSNWYKARTFVLDKLKKVAILPEEDAHLHVVVLEDDELMLSIVRQVALLAHFPNHDEERQDETKRNRTSITLVSKNENIINTLMQEEYLCNLPRFCQTTVGGDVKKRDSYIDIELEIVNHWSEEIEEYTEIKNYTHIEKRFVFRKSDVEKFCEGKTDEEIRTIDTRKAQYANMVYALGGEIDNLPYEDIHSIKRYSMAMNVFKYNKLKVPTNSMVREDWVKEENQIKVMTSLSNIFCADCFMIRYNSIKRYWINGKIKENQAWENIIEALSKSEHARWVVEKLILGYRPVNLQERLMDESLVIDGVKRKEYRKRLKNNWRFPVHIDICSFSDLRRIDPDTLKYDSFLMLSIPDILNKVGELS